MPTKKAAAKSGKGAGTTKTAKVETSPSSVILGFYIPLINHYHSIELNDTIAREEFNNRRNELIGFLQLCVNGPDLYKRNLHLLELTGLEMQDIVNVFTL